MASKRRGGGGSGGGIYIAHVFAGNSKRKRFVGEVLRRPAVLHVTASASERHGCYTTASLLPLAPAKLPLKQLTLSPRATVSGIAVVRAASVVYNQRLGVLYASTRRGGGGYARASFGVADAKTFFAGYCCSSSAFTLSCFSWCVRRPCLHRRSATRTVYLSAGGRRVRSLTLRETNRDRRNVMNGFVVCWNRAKSHSSFFFP